MQVMEGKTVQLEEDLYASLYDEVFPMIASLVSRQGGTRADAEDVFHDALIALWEMRERTAIRNNGRYVVGIAKHIWARKSKRDVNLLRLDDFEKNLSIPEVLITEPSMSRLLRLVQRAGARCMELLSDFYFSGLTIEQIASRHNLGSVHSASVQKHKCIEKIRNAVQEKRYSYEDFLE